MIMSGLLLINSRSDKTVHIEIEFTKSSIQKHGFSNLINE